MAIQLQLFGPEKQKLALMSPRDIFAALSPELIRDAGEKGKFIPNNALAMLAGRQPRRIIPGCRVRVQRFPGTVEGAGPSYNPIRDRFFEGNIVRI
jgi:predicted HTH transcriptional regulator